MFDLENMPFDPDEFPFGVDAGNNKLGLTRCPFCKSEGFEVPTMDGETIRSFAFRDHLSAQEYLISGLCQDCQDGVFTEPEEEPFDDDRDDGAPF